MVKWFKNLCQATFVSVGLTFSALAIAGIGLSACNGLTFNQVTSQVAQDASTIADGLAGAFSNIQTLNIPGLTPDKVANINLSVQTLKAAATALQGAMNATSAQATVNQIEAALNAIVSTLAGLPLPTQIQLPLAAASILLPVIETALNMVITKINVPTATTPAGAAAARIASPDEARSILKGSALKH